MIGIIIGILVAAFLAVVLFRTLKFAPKAQPAVSQETVELDQDAVINALSELVRCKTISYHDASLEDDAEFRKLIDKLPSLYPYVFETCTMQELPGRALLFRWPGKDHSEPAVLMAHYDVVPVNEDNWEKPPFEAILEGDVLWGRGTLDTKVTINGVLFAANQLIAGGFQPEHDIYFAFSGGEEVSGPGATNIVKRFQEEGITPGIVVDEGGAVVEDVFPGVKGPIGLIGIAEKGMIDAQFRCMSAGGHASAPKPTPPWAFLPRPAPKWKTVPSPPTLKVLRLSCSTPWAVIPASCTG